MRETASKEMFLAGSCKIVFNFFFPNEEEETKKKKRRSQVTVTSSETDGDASEKAAWCGPTDSSPRGRSVLSVCVCVGGGACVCVGGRVWGGACVCVCARRLPGTREPLRLAVWLQEALMFTSLSGGSSWSRDRVRLNE